MVSLIGSFLQYLLPKLKRNREFILIYVRSFDGFMKPDNEFIQVALETLKYYGSLFITLNMDLQHDKDIVLAAVNQDGSVLQYVSDELKCDRDIVLTALRQNGNAIKYISDDLLRDKEIVLTSIRQNRKAIKHVFQMN
jgi:Domain of unknown function (DUF4116)